MKIAKALAEAEGTLKQRFMVFAAPVPPLGHEEPYFYFYPCLHSSPDGRLSPPGGEIAGGISGVGMMMTWSLAL